MDKLNAYIKLLYKVQRGGHSLDSSSSENSSSENSSSENSSSDINNNKSSTYEVQYFPEKNNKILIDEVGKYSISKPYATKFLLEKIQQNMPSKLLNYTITDGTACIGGDTLAFSRNFKSVNSVEYDKTRFEYLKHNMKLFECKNISFYNDSYINLYKSLKQDVIYLDPPWGGPEYKNMKTVTLSLGDMKIDELCKDIIKNKLCQLIILKLPYNYDLSTFNFRFRKYYLKRILFVFIPIV
jgi:hypothetical protein